jgi:hypothetical protein
LFVKFSRDFDDPVRDRGRTQMEPEVRFAALAQCETFPIAVPVTMFADYHGESGTGLLISQRIAFGSNGVERQYHKCLDYEMPDPVGHYRALLSAVARLAGTHRAGVLPQHLLDRFPVDLQAATVGARVSLTPDRLNRRLRRLTDFLQAHPGLFAPNLRTRPFASRLIAQGHTLIEREPAIWQHLRDADDYIALCHWNANVDNAWFWRDRNGLQCGLMDWGCVSQMNMAMAVWGALSGAETYLWNLHLDALLEMFCAEVRVSGGPPVDAVVLRSHLILYATLMAVTWLLDVPALLDKRIPGLDAHTTRLDPPIKHHEGIRAPLQMLVNALNLWESRGLDDGLAALQPSPSELSRRTGRTGSR